MTRLRIQTSFAVTKFLNLRLLTLACLLCWGSLDGATATAASRSDKPIAKGSETVENFRLTDHTGRSHELYRYAAARAIVLCVGGNGCPIVRQSVATLKELRDQFGGQGVVFAMLNANSQDDSDSIAKEAAEFEIPFPILVDSAQLVARSLHVTRTAEAIVIDPKTWTIIYRGAINDRLGYGNQKAKATENYLAAALTHFLAGQKVSPDKTPVKGCAVTFASSGGKPEQAVSYASQVAPILQKHCVGCHSPGQIGPFAMSSHQKVAGWASTIRETILEQRMPPWHADPHHGAFANDRSLSREEAHTLLNWIDQGAPRGDGADPLAANPPAAAEPWPLGKPDYVVSLSAEETIPATGQVDYRYVVVDAPATEDVWVRAAVVRPGNLKVLHHCLVFLKYPDALKGQQPNYHGGAGGYFIGYVPGTLPTAFPEGTGKFIPKGSQIIFQMHYTPTGKEEKDRTEIGLYVLPAKPAMELRTRAAAQNKFEIPAGESDHEVRGEYRFKKDALLYSLSPHMHLRGSRFRYDALYPDGRTETILSVPHYDFNWQTLYELAEPKKIPAGTRLVCTGAFDNAPSNPANPDATKLVKWGDQSWNEMFIGYVNFAELPGQPEKKKLSARAETFPNLTAP
jgi:peroxiredoxin